MVNTSATAASWVSYLSRQSEIPFRSLLQSHFNAGAISRLCDCGCNSFDIAIPAGTVLPPLCQPRSQGGKFSELVCESTGGAEVAFLFFIDSRGYLAGIDVTAGSGNHTPLPENLSIGKVLYAI